MSCSAHNNDCYYRSRYELDNNCVIVRFSAALLSVQLMRQVSCEARVRLQEHAPSEQRFTAVFCVV